MRLPSLEWLKAAGQSLPEKAGLLSRGVNEGDSQLKKTDCGGNDQGHNDVTLQGCPATWRGGRGQEIDRSID